MTARHGPLQRLQPDDDLAPRLLADGVEDLVAGRGQLLGGCVHGLRVGDVELDADLRNRAVSGPVGPAEAGLRRLV